MKNRKARKTGNDHGIGRVSINKGTPEALIRKIEIRLINAKLFISWDGKGFVVNDLSAARQLLSKPIVIFTDEKE